MCTDCKSQLALERLISWRQIWARGAKVTLGKFIPGQVRGGHSEAPVQPRE